MLLKVFKAYKMSQSVYKLCTNDKNGNEKHNCIFIPGRPQAWVRGATPENVI